MSLDMRTEARTASRAADPQFKLKMKIFDRANRALELTTERSIAEFIDISERTLYRMRRDDFDGMVVRKTVGAYRRRRRILAEKGVATTVSIDTFFEVV